MPAAFATRCARRAPRSEKLNALPALDPSERNGRLAETLARLGQTEEAIATGRRYVAARSPDKQVRGR